MDTKEEKLRTASAEAISIPRLSDGVESADGSLDVDDIRRLGIDDVVKCLEGVSLSVEVDKEEQELNMLRQLLSAEASADACDLLEAQDTFLSSGFVEGVDEEFHQEKTSVQARKIRESIINTNSTFKTSTAAELFDQEIFKTPQKDSTEPPKRPSGSYFRGLKTKSSPKTGNVDKVTVRLATNNADRVLLTTQTRAVDEVTVNDLEEKSPSEVDDSHLGIVAEKSVWVSGEYDEVKEETNSQFVDAEIEIDEKSGLKDEFIDPFFDSFEESEHLQKMLNKINILEYRVIFDQDDKFEDEFKWWCRACLRSRRYRIDRAIELLQKYCSWRLSMPFFNEIRSLSSKQTHNSKTDRDNCSPVIGDIEKFSDDGRCNDNPAQNNLLDRAKSKLQSGFALFYDEARCREGRGVIVLRMWLHNFESSNTDDLLLCIHNVIVHAFKTDPITQAKGFTIILDLTKCSWDAKIQSQVEAVCQALNSTLPVRYGRLLVYNPPTYFNLLYKCMNIFMSSKMKERMARVFKKPREPQRPETRGLFKYIDQDQLPTFYAGTQQINTLVFANDVLWSLTN